MSLGGGLHGLHAQLSHLGQQSSGAGGGAALWSGTTRIQVKSVNVVTGEAQPAVSASTPFTHTVQAAASKNEAKELIAASLLQQIERARVVNPALFTVLAAANHAPRLQTTAHAAAQAHAAHVQQSAVAATCSHGLTCRLFLLPDVKEMLLSLLRTFSRCYDLIWDVIKFSCLSLVQFRLLNSIAIAVPSPIPVRLLVRSRLSHLAVAVRAAARMAAAVCPRVASLRARRGRVGDGDGRAERQAHGGRRRHRDEHAAVARQGGRRDGAGDAAQRRARVRRRSRGTGGPRLDVRLGRKQRAQADQAASQRSVGGRGGGIGTGVDRGAQRAASCG